MATTPIFDTLHADRFTDQCSGCQDVGWPTHLFVCINDDLTCTDY